MENPPLVSVILPSYNHARFVERAVMSALEQTHPAIQLIVIDDGSTDGSKEILARLAETHGFDYVSQENRGVIATLNRAKEMVRGKYVSLASSDDYYDPRKFEVLTAVMEAHPEYAVVHSKIILVDENEREIIRIEEPCRSGMVFDDLLNWRFHINGISALVRADVFAGYKYEGKYIDDLLMWLRIARDHQIGFVDEFLAYYRRHGAQVTANESKMRKSEWEILRSFSDAPGYREAVVNWRIKWFKHLSAQTDRSRLRTAIGFGLLLMLTTKPDQALWNATRLLIKNEFRALFGA